MSKLLISPQQASLNGLLQFTAYAAVFSFLVLTIASCSEADSNPTDRRDWGGKENRSTENRSKEMEIVTDSDGIDVEFEMLQPLTVKNCKGRITFTNLSEEHLRFSLPNGDFQYDVVTNGEMSERKVIVGYSSDVFPLKIGESRGWVVDFAKKGTIRTGKNTCEVHVRPGVGPMGQKGSRSLRVQVKNIVFEIEESRSDEMDIVTDSAGLDVKFELFRPLTIENCKGRMTFTNRSVKQLQFRLSKGDFQYDVVTNGEKHEMRDLNGEAAETIIMKVGESRGWVVDFAKKGTIRTGKNTCEIHTSPVSVLVDQKDNHSFWPLKVRVKNIVFEI